MIRQIVFDMGNVLRSFEVENIINQYTDKDSEKTLIKEKLFSHLWGELDKGTVTYEEVKSQLRQELSEQVYLIAEKLLDTWHLHMPVDPRMEKLIPTLKDNGYHLYLLSNASVRFTDYQKTTPLFDYFDGFIVSGFFKTVKPEKELYEILFRTYHLIPSECAFVDDLPANVATGNALGMKGYVYDGDFQKLMNFFDEIGVHYEKE